MNEQIKNGILEGRIILFLGAGASFGSKNKRGVTPPLGKEIAKTIAEKCGWDYQGEPLGTVYSAARSILGVDLDNLLKEQYMFCTPSADYRLLASFPWARIYTTNIDDAFERALEATSKQDINIKYRFHRIEDKDQLLSRVEYVYLNGSVKSPDDGYVFSPEEYGKASAKSPQWYEEVATDFLQSCFIFVGTALDEPVLYHQIERYKERAGLDAPLSYVITPNASPIEKASLNSYGLKHISGTLSDFCDWLKCTFSIVPDPIDVAKNKYPELANVLDGGTPSDRYTAELLKNVVLVSRESLSLKQEKIDKGTIRKFYKGFKATWQDVLDGVPANLNHFVSFIGNLESAEFEDKKLFALIGAGGSGKSTMLKVSALKLANNGSRVYYLPSGTENIRSILKELEKHNIGRYYIFVERIDPIKDELAGCLDPSIKAVFVSADSKNVWYNRLEVKFSKPYVHKSFIDDISQDDVLPILEKVREFGPWTRLAKMSERERKREIYDRSKRQLLIGLMEATTGVGFEQIIIKEYESVIDKSDRFFFVLVCIATMHRCSLSETLAARAMASSGYSESPAKIASKLMGIIDRRDSNFTVRHPIYARKIIESVVDTDLISSAIESLLIGYRVYKHPVVQSLGKNESDLFKAIINHKFLVDVLRSNEEKISRIYHEQEKYFEEDGLFWLQYGLFKRDFNRNIEALEILQTAYNAYPHDHTTHALAQQKLILSSRSLLPEEQSRSHMLEAISLLEALDKSLESDDTYPIVTLAEGHIASMIQLDGVAMARIKAREYLDRIDRRMKGIENQRIRDSKAKLLKLATTGTWSESA